jgi:hypothetical protein
MGEKGGVKERGRQRELERWRAERKREIEIKRDIKRRGGGGEKEEIERKREMKWRERVLCYAKICHSRKFERNVVLYLYLNPHDFLKSLRPLLPSRYQQ